MSVFDKLLWDKTLQNTSDGGSPVLMRQLSCHPGACAYTRACGRHFCHNPSCPAGYVCIFGTHFSLLSDCTAVHATAADLQSWLGISSHHIHDHGSWQLGQAKIYSSTSCASLFASQELILPSGHSYATETKLPG